MTPIIIDGATGEGGGQILRSSLSLSLLTGRGMVMTNIRANRKKPGLKRQHLTCIRAAQAISQATVKGNELGSSTLHFYPKSVNGGKHHFDTGSAGSTTLVCQTVLLPLLLSAKEPSQLTFSGGTHNPMAPSLSFLEACFLPVLAHMGAQCSVSTERIGFMPAGGGQWKMEIAPSTLSPLQLTTPQKINKQRVVTLQSGIHRSVAERGHSEYKTLSTAIDEYQFEFMDSPCPGIAMAHYIDFEHYSLMVERLGRHRLPIEKIARDIAKNAKQLAAANHIACEYLEDQLLLPLAVCGGELKISHNSSHTKTNIDLINQWLPNQITQTIVDGLLVQVRSLGTTP